MRVSCNVSAAPRAYIVEATMPTTGSVHQWFRDLVRGRRRPAAARRAGGEAARVPPGCNGLLLLPHFMGCGSPHWDPQARGAFVNRA